MKILKKYAKGGQTKERVGESGPKDKESKESAEKIKHDPKLPNRQKMEEWSLIKDSNVDRGPKGNKGKKKKKKKKWWKKKKTPMKDIVSK